eukprot:9471093-Pyramimonas_sp.AAC.1
MVLHSRCVLFVAVTTTLSLAQKPSPHHAHVSYGKSCMKLLANSTTAGWAACGGSAGAPVSPTIWTSSSSSPGPWAGGGGGGRRQRGR